MDLLLLEHANQELPILVRLTQFQIILMPKNVVKYCLHHQHHLPHPHQYLQHLLPLLKSLLLLQKAEIGKEEK